MTFYPLEKIPRLHNGYRRTFKVAGHHLLLLQHEGKPVLLDNICPHAGYPLEEGKMIDGKLRCPMHGYLFDLDSGDCTFSPEGPCNAVQVYEVVQQDGMLGVKLGTLAT
jgi:nitrite reductase/ring-hydroxylating ferredoxin subunit